MQKIFFAKKCFFFYTELAVSQQKIYEMISNFEDTRRKHYLGQ